MKRWIALVLMIALGLSLLGCASSVDVEDNERVSITFQRHGKRIQRALNKEEAKQIIDIVNDKRYFDMSWDSETCAFDSTVAITVGETVFAVAKDGCAMFKDLSNDELILLTAEEYAVVVALFDTYGGYLPCLEKP